MLVLGDGKISTQQHSSFVGGPSAAYFKNTYSMDLVIVMLLVVE